MEEHIMSWKRNCLAALDSAKMFENSRHRTRFKELIDCYSSFPFFTKGLCKCMYLSAWDDIHFYIMLETLTDLSLGKENDTKEMREKGDFLAEEQTSSEYYVYQLSNSFLDNSSFQIDEAADIPSDTKYILQRGLDAAAIIDQL